MGKKRKAIVLVTEGVSRPLLERWCERGLLPGFARLLGEGGSGQLNSHLVPYEPPGLLTAFTCKPPGEHGWYSYWNVHNHDYRPRPLGSGDLRHPFIWERQEAFDKRFAVVNVFGTHPPKPFNGWLITYPTQQTLAACYPRELLWSLSNRGVSYTHDVSVWFSGQAREDFLGRVLEADRRRGDAALALWSEGADALVLNLTSIDRTSHCYWQELDEGSPVPETESAIFRAYSLCDRIISNFSERVTEHTSLLAFSEVGFGPLRAYCSVNEYLAAVGLLTTQACEGVEVVDWEKTLAFEAVQGTHGININLASRYVHGRVQPRDYESARRQVIAALGAYINPYTGLRLFRRVLPREEVYEGQAVVNAPDIIVEPEDERYLPLGEPLWARHVHRTLQSGWHRRNSYWAGYGGEFVAGKQTACASLLDIGPTISRMLGLELEENYSGAPLGLR